MAKIEFVHFLVLFQVFTCIESFSFLQFYDGSLNSQKVLEMCPNFAPDQVVPKFDEPSNLQFSMNLWYLIDIDNAAEEMAFAALLEIKWTNISCSNGDEFANLTKKVKLKPRPNMFWTPSVIIVQSEQNTLMSGDRKESLGLVVHPPRGKTPAQFYWNWAIRGVFRFHCDLDLFLFPNDIQNCSIKFQMDETPMFYQFNECSISDFKKEKFTLKNSNWKILNVTCQVKQDFALASTVVVSFEMARNPRYFMTHMVTPCLLLLVLELCSFALPADGAERTGFTMTIYLAFVFMESIMVTILPQTPRQILVADLIMLQSIFSTIITVYTALLSKFANRLSKSKVTVGYKIGKITWLTIVDSAAFSLSILVYIVVSLWMTWQYHNGPSY